jgi:ureidoacrylate peracid hydrolase
LAKGWDVDSLAVSPQAGLPTLADRIAPGRTALVVVDMQNDYVSEGGATHRVFGTVEPAAAIIPTLQALLACARTAGVVVAYTQLTLDEAGRWLSEAERLRRRQRWGETRVVVRGSWGHAIASPLAPQPGDIMIEKTRPPAFLGTTLDVILRSLGVQSVVITGAALYGCVLATANMAAWLDYDVTIVSDAVAGWNARLNEASLDLMASSLGVPDSVVPAARITEVWGRQVRRGAGAPEARAPRGARSSAGSLRAGDEG